jgi:hypothetical protein
MTDVSERPLRMPFFPYDYSARLKEPIGTTCNSHDNYIISSLIEISCWRTVDDRAICGAFGAAFTEHVFHPEVLRNPPHRPEQYNRYFSDILY